MPQVQSPAFLDRQLDPRVSDRLARVQREHYKIGVCAGCGGPEVFAKTKPAARCLRCGRYRVLAAIAPYAKAHRCLACTFCYGPKTCALYRAGAARTVPGRKGMSWREEDWVDEE